MSMDRYVFRISVMGGQIFRVKRETKFCALLRMSPPPEDVLHPELFCSFYKKSSAYFARSSKKLAFPECICPPPPVCNLTDIFNKLFWSGKGAANICQGGGQDSPPERADTPVTPLSKHFSNSQIRKISRF